MWHRLIFALLVMGLVGVIVDIFPTEKTNSAGLHPEFVYLHDGRAEIAAVRGHSAAIDWQPLFQIKLLPAPDARNVDLAIDSGWHWFTDATTARQEIQLFTGLENWGRAGACPFEILAVRVKNRGEIAETQYQCEVVRGEIVFSPAS